MLDDPFLYRFLSKFRKELAKNLLLACIGPALWLAPVQLQRLVPKYGGACVALEMGTCLLVAFLCLRALAVSVGKVSGERERDSWEVLFSAGLTPGRITAGLLLAALLPCFIELTLLVPALYWFHVQYGLHLWQSFSLGLVWLGIVAFHCSLGLYYSLRNQSTLKAAQWAYGWVTLWVLMSLLMFGGPFRATGKNLDFPLFLNPWVLALTTLKSASQTPPPWIFWGLSFFVLGTLVLIWRIHCLVGQPLHSSTPSRKPRSRCRPQESNPILYQGRYRSHLRPTMFLGFLYVAFFMTAAPQPNQGDLWLTLVSLGHLGFWILPAVFYTIQALGQERERRTLDTLLVSRLQPSEILYGICRQTLIPVSGLALLLSPATLSLVGFRLESWFLLTALTQAVVWGSGLGALAVSMHSRNTLGAFQRVYLALAFVYLGSFIVDLAFLNPLLGLSRPLLSLVSPLFATLAVTLGQLRSDPEIDTMIWQSLFASIAFHLAIALGSLAYLWRRLGRP